MAAMQRVEARDAARHCTEHTTQHSPCHREISGLTCLQYKVEKLWASRCGVLWSQITLPGHDSACAGTMCQDLPQPRWGLLLHVLLAHPGSKSGTWLQPLLSGCRQLGRAPQHSMAACVISSTRHLPAAGQGVLNMGHSSPPTALQ